MTPWGSPAGGAPEGASEGERPERRALLLGRSVAAPLLLAVTTLAAVTGAFLALLPAAVRRRPAGRLAARAEDGAAERAASEPLAP